MNNFRSAKRLAQLAAFVISLVLYGGVIALVVFWADQLTNEPPTIPVEISLNWSEAPRIEQVAVEEPPPPVEQELPEPEEADVALEEVVEEPEPEPVPAEAQVTQEAAAPEPAHEKEALIAWVYAQVEKEKYYPSAARRSGLEGEFRFRVVVNSGGEIVSADVLPGGHGSFLLRRALEKMITVLPGKEFPGELATELILEVPFKFELK